MKKTINLSASSVKLFKESQLVYYFKYILHLKPTKPSIQVYADAGSIVHHAIEKVINKELITDEELNKYTIHLIDNGIREKRPFKIEHIVPTFNLEYYRKNYNDLHNLTCMQLIEHYVRYGKEEGRICDNLIESVEFI